MMSDLRTNLSTPQPTAFVTGASGFLGSHLVERLQGLGWKVIVLTRSPAAKEKALALGCEAVDRDELQTNPAHFNGAAVSVLFHLAGLTKTIDLNDFNAVNAGFTEEILTSLWASGFRGRVIHISSLAAAGPVQSRAPRRVEMPMKPVSYYGRSKLLGERVAKSWSNRLPITILRPGAIYGPRDKDFLEVLKTLTWGVSLAIGNPLCVQLTHVEDIVDACIKASQSPITIGKAYFVNDPQVWNYDAAMSVLGGLLGHQSVRTIRLPVGLARVLAKGLDFVSRLAGKPLSPFTEDKWREVTAGNWIADSSPLTQDCGWKAKKRLMPGMKETIAWYKAEGLL